MLPTTLPLRRALLHALLLSNVFAAPLEDTLTYVDPLVGSSAGGHVFAGPTMPFGMAKPVADSFSDNQGGFSTPGNSIRGFSHMHDSGTGGSPSLGNFPILPQIGCPDDDVQKCKLNRDQRMAQYVETSVRAQPGYFALTLTDGTKAEITAANRTALYRFTFPGGLDGTLAATPGMQAPKARPGFVYSPVLVMDITDLPDTRTFGGAKVNSTSGRVTAYGTFEPSFGHGTYTAYTCIDVKGLEIRDAGVFKNNRAAVAPEVKVVPDGINGAGGSPRLPAGTWVRFKGKVGQPETLTVRVGLSFISTDKACQNAEVEVGDWGFDRVRSENVAAWREKLSPVSVSSFGVNQDYLRSFWSGLYRNFISPQDYTGENPLWKSTEPYYDSYYCIWDSFRSMHQLLTLVDPASQTLMVRSLIDIYRHEGFLPDCRMSLCKGFTQGGSNADTLLVDSWLKGISNGVDWKTAYEAMLKDAEVEPEKWSVEGRGGLESWKTLGFVPQDDFDPIGSGPFTRSVSRTVEYAYNDYSIALMASLSGKTQDADKYFTRSHNWKNLFKPDQRSDINLIDTGFVGFLQPKLSNGSWAYQDPVTCSHASDFDGCYLNPMGKETYEGSPWLYSFYAPGDMAAVIASLGGAETFVRRLNYYHETSIQYIGDEQAFLLVYLYHYAGRPGLSAARAHSYIPKYFKGTHDGLPGNDDSGAMGSFVVLSMLGIFPNAGQNVYLITPPFFPEVSITSQTSGKKAVIRNVNFDAAYRNIYVQSATLDGEPYTKNWITHEFFVGGGVLELTLGEKESAWGTRPEDLPPSLSTSGWANSTLAKLDWDVASKPKGDREG